jgi:hypothetical protein
VCFSPDGRSLAAGCGCVVRLWDERGLPVKVFRGHEAEVSDLAFSPDGRRLISAGHDGTALVWDTEWVPPSQEQPPVVTHAVRLWERLADDDAEVAYQAMLALHEHPERAVALLADRLVSARALEQKELQRLLAGLDGDTARERRQAAEELHRLDLRVEKELRDAEKTGRTAEMRKAASRLLHRLEDGTLHPDRLREVRAVEVLENIGTPAAKALLHRLAAGADSRLTREAEAALKRLASRARVAPR